MSTPEPPPGPAGPGPEPYVPLSPLLPTDPPKIGDFWLDARLHATRAGTAFTGYDADNTPVMVLLLSEGAAADGAARDRMAGAVNELHIDTLLARGGHGQDTGRMAGKFQSEDDDPVAPDGQIEAPWAALFFDGSPAAAAEAGRILDAVDLDGLASIGRPVGPEYQLHWTDRIRPGISRVWPLPWPGRFDRAGWRTILVSWFLMLLIAALAVLIAILIFRHQPPQAPPPPVQQSSSASPPPQSGSPPPQSGSPSPQSGSPSSGSASPSPSGSSPGQSGSPSPSGSESGGGQPTPSDSGTPVGSPSPRSKL